MMTNDPPIVGLVIPTLNAGTQWAECLAALANQTFTVSRLLNIDSASNDCTVEQARANGFEIVSIPRAEFNHGATRQLAAEYLQDCDILIYLTQDAILASPESLSRLVACFRDPSVAVAYGRQLPHVGATAIESHGRIFNYGSCSAKKDSEAAKQLGSKVFFCSNSFAAYRRSTLMKLGGFNKSLILGEDMEFAARAISAGFANFYCADAEVRHSHDYSLKQTLERYFDIGVFDSMNKWMHVEFGSHAGTGMRYVESEMAYLRHNAPTQIPKALCELAAKFIGYRLGRLQRLLPVAVKRNLSMFPSYYR